MFWGIRMKILVTGKKADKHKNQFLVAVIKNSNKLPKKATLTGLSTLCYCNH